MSKISGVEGIIPQKHKGILILFTTGRVSFDKGIAFPELNTYDKLERRMKPQGTMEATRKLKCSLRMGNMEGE